MSERGLREIIGNYKVGNEPFYTVKWTDSETPVLNVRPDELKAFKEDLMKYWLQKVGLVDADRLFKNAKEQMQQFEEENPFESNAIQGPEVCVQLIDCWKDEDVEIKKLLRGFQSRLAEPHHPSNNLHENRDDVDEVLDNPNVSAADIIEKTAVKKSAPSFQSRSAEPHHASNDLQENRDDADEVLDNSHVSAAVIIEQTAVKKSARKSLLIKKNAKDRNRNFLLPCYVCKLYFNERAFRDHFKKHKLVQTGNDGCCYYCGTECQNDEELKKHAEACKLSLRTDPDQIPASKRAKRGAPKKLQTE